MRIIISILLNALSLYIGAWLIKGVALNSPWTAIIAGIILGLANITIKPLLNLFALPITILTLGFFILIINAIVLLIVAFLVPGFIISGFFSAFLLGLLLLVLNLLYAALHLKGR
jgi:putative membrane protein